MLFKSISLKSKFVVMMLVIALGSALLTGYLGLKSGEQALTDRISSQLTSVRESRRTQVMQWIEERRNEVKALAVDHTVTMAMQEFSSAYRQLEKAQNINTKDASLNLLKYYQTEYMPKINNLIGSEADIDLYYPKTTVGKFLQHAYISNNSLPADEKHTLNSIDNRSYYDGVHLHYHPVFKQFAHNFGFHDLFLVDINNGNIIYSVKKHPDFATNLINGPYRNSNLGKLFSQAKHAQDMGRVQLSDFGFYRPVEGRPAAFMGIVLFDENKIASGMLVVHIALDRLNQVMTGNKGWEKQGLGETGEAFLVGADNLMRSDARLLFNTNRNDSNDSNGKGDVDETNPSESKDTCYATQLQQDELMDKATADKICHLKTSVLLQKIDNKAIQEALQGRSGTGIVDSYSGKKVLAAYAPLHIGSMKWVISAQIDLDEANRPIYDFQRELGVSIILIVCLVTFLSMIAAYFFTQPLAELIQGIRKLSRGETDIDIKMGKHNEYGELAEKLNSTAKNIKQQQATLAVKDQQSYDLLLNSLPERVIRQVGTDGREFAERVDSVTVLYTSLANFEPCIEHKNPLEAIALLNELFASFDEAVAEHGAEQVKTIGDNYIAASGLNISHLDHAERSVKLAKALLQKVTRFNEVHNSQLTMRVGIHSGSVIAGIIGHSRFIYDLWGEAIKISGRIRYAGDMNSIIISDQTYQSMAQREGFTKSSVTLKNGDTLTIWCYQATMPTTVTNLLKDSGKED